MILVHHYKDDQHKHQIHNPKTNCISIHSFEVFIIYIRQILTYTPHLMVVEPLTSRRLGSTGNTGATGSVTLCYLLTKSPDCPLISVPLSYKKISSKI